MSNLPFLAERAQKQNMQLLFYSRKIILESAVQAKLIQDDALATVPETIPILCSIVGELRDDYYRDPRAQSANGKLNFPSMQKCFCYCFAKGAEAAFQWNSSPAGQVNFNYSKDDALEGRAGADVTQEFANFISVGMIIAADVFCDFQNEFIVKPQFNFSQGGRWLADGIACGFFWAAMVGLDYGMNQLGFK